MNESLLGLYEFKILPEDEQWAYLWANAIFIANRAVEGYKVNLYSLGDFFVEVYYTEATNEISHLRTFRNKQLLIPYLMVAGINWN